MLITLLVVGILAIMFFMISGKAKRNWLRRSFKVYGLLFAASAAIICVIFINENKTTIKSVFTNLDAVGATSAETSFVSKSHDAKQVSDAMETMKLPLEIPHKKTLQLEAPSVGQMPELPRGCEVTSLAMLLQYHDVDIGKMELAEKVKKNPATFEMVDDVVHFGSPYNGFVGDMLALDTPGVGVYHGPIADLANNYVGNRVHDFTGEDFDTIIDELNKHHPVWVIITSTYKKLPEEAFRTWETEDGPLDVTMREHSVLITGYDEDYIYFNDPLQFNDRADIDNFKAAWIQMGKQAITIE